MEARKKGNKKSPPFQESRHLTYINPLPREVLGIFPKNFRTCILCLVDTVGVFKQAAVLCKYLYRFLFYLFHLFLLCVFLFLKSSAGERKSFFALNCTGVKMLPPPPEDF